MQEREQSSSLPKSQADSDEQLIEEYQKYLDKGKTNTFDQIPAPPGLADNMLPLHEAGAQIESLPPPPSFAKDKTSKEPGNLFSKLFRPKTPMAVQKESPLPTPNETEKVLGTPPPNPEQSAPKDEQLSRPKDHILSKSFDHLLHEESQTGAIPPPPPFNVYKISKDADTSLHNSKEGQLSSAKEPLVSEPKKIESHKPLNSLPEFNPSHPEVGKELPLSSSPPPPPPFVQVKDQKKKGGLFSKLFRPFKKPEQGKTPPKSMLSPPIDALPKSSLPAGLGIAPRQKELGTQKPLAPALSNEFPGAAIHPKKHIQLPADELEKPFTIGGSWEKERAALKDTKQSLEERGLLKSDLNRTELPPPLEEKLEEKIMPVIKQKRKPKVKRKTAPKPKKKNPRICELCNRRFKNAKGVKIHQMQKHPEDYKEKEKESSITKLIENLEQEKKELKKIEKQTAKDDKKLSILQGHNEIITMLENLEKKRIALETYEKSLKHKESELTMKKDTYHRDAAYIDNLKRRLDHDVRERTNYLVNLEKDFYQKGQNLAKRMEDLNSREKHLKEKEKLLAEKEKALKELKNQLHDKQVSVRAKEKHVNKLRLELGKQEALIKKKDNYLSKKEKELEEKLDAAKQHEKAAKELMTTKRKEYIDKERELKQREEALRKKRKKVDIDNRAISEAQNRVEEQKERLSDDQFKQYLHEKLGAVKESGIELEDIQQTASIEVPDLQDHTTKGDIIFDLIGKCRHLLKTRHTIEAKIFYNEIRDRYYTTRFSDEEKQRIHNIIRQLYDEINLAELEK